MAAVNESLAPTVPRADSVARLAGLITVTLWGSAFVAIVGSSLSGFAAWTFALRRTSAGRRGAMTYLIPLIAVLLGWAILGETPPWLAVAGGALCLEVAYVGRRG